ncbi:hypothetical protein LguiB_026393 [Lonicera macranthoides]
MNSPRTKIVKTFSENENSENEDCKTENDSSISVPSTSIVMAVMLVCTRVSSGSGGSVVLERSHDNLGKKIKLIGSISEDSLRQRLVIERLEIANQICERLDPVGPSKLEACPFRSLNCGLSFN